MLLVWDVMGYSAGIQYDKNSGQLLGYAEDWNFGLCVQSGPLFLSDGLGASTWRTSGCYVYLSVQHFLPIHSLLNFFLLFFK